MDWREMEDGVLRREAKAEHFRELYGATEPPRPLGPRTGRMVITEPPLDLDAGCTCRAPNPTVIDSLYPQHHAWCAIEKAKEA